MAICQLTNRRKLTLEGVKEKGFRSKRGESLIIETQKRGTGHTLPFRWTRTIDDFALLASGSPGGNPNGVVVKEFRLLRFAFGFRDPVQGLHPGTKRGGSRTNRPIAAK